MLVPEKQILHRDASCLPPANVDLKLFPSLNCRVNAVLPFASFAEPTCKLIYDHDLTVPGLRIAGRDENPGSPSQPFPDTHRDQPVR